MCSLLRDVRYDSRLQQLTTLPIGEYSTLQTSQLVPTIIGRRLTTAQPSVALGKGRQLDITVVFALPAKATAATQLGVAVLAAADLSHRTDVYLSPAEGSSWALTVNTSLSGDVPGHANDFPTATQRFSVLPHETTLSLRVVLDRSIVEAFAQQGRAVVTATPFAPANASAAMAWVRGGGTGGVVLERAESFGMGCAWQENEE
jgi:sucrose-6-phosphate hydrolase SacC (GH32 family)